MSSDAQASVIEDAHTDGHADPRPIPTSDESELRRSQFASSLPASTYILEQPRTEGAAQICDLPLPAVFDQLCSTRLVVDEEDADLYIVSPADLIADTTDEHLEDHQSSGVTLLESYSRPAPGSQSSQQRYLRCPNKQLDDFVEWFSAQRHSPTIIPGEDAHLNVDSALPLTNEQIAICREELASASTLWTPVQQHLAAMTLYCAANGMRDLARPELLTAVKIGMRITYRTADFVKDSEGLSSLVESCLNNLSQTMLVQNVDKVEFRQDLMKRFIRRSNLPHLQAGHSTMTRICFEQIKQLGAALMIQPWYRFRSWFSSVSEWPLVGYVVNTWFLHYRMTADRADIDSELYHLLREALFIEMPSHPSMLLERRMVDAGYGISKIYHLPGLEAVLRNMGARTAQASDSVLGRLLTETQWRRMNWRGSLKPTPDYELGSDAIRVDEIAMSEDSECDAVMVHIERHLERTSLSSDTTTNDVDTQNMFNTAAATPNVCIESNCEGQKFTTRPSDSNAPYSEIEWDQVDTRMTDKF